MNKNDLPNKIAIFPLSNAIFFPRTILPLNIFEKKYLQMITDCMKKDRMFGMVQPKNKGSVTTEVYDIGCLGKIVSFNETDDNRFIISLSGIIRFRIKKELKIDNLYRNFEVDYSEFLNDLDINKNKLINFNKKNLLDKIKIFFEKINYPIDFDELEKLNIDQLISTVSMISPFSIQEKQKLIETVEINNKIKVLDEIINFSLLGNQENKTIQ